MDLICFFVENRYIWFDFVLENMKIVLIIYLLLEKINDKNIYDILGLFLMLLFM